VQIVNEHELDDRLSRLSRKTRQEDRLTRTGAVTEFSSANISSLHTDANSTTRNDLCKSLVRLGTI